MRPLRWCGTTSPLLKATNTGHQRSRRLELPRLLGHRLEDPIPVAKRRQHGRGDRPRVGGTEFISIRHLGFISNGIEDTTSDAIRSWAPAYENYTLLLAPQGTKMVVDQDVAAEWEEYLTQAWPKALNLLKELCESTSAALTVSP